jgi:uncharacterized protein
VHRRESPSREHDPAEVKASLYLVVSSGLLALLLMASRQFSWLDVSVSMAAMLPVAIGMYAGQHLRDKIEPETFRKLVLIAVIAAGAAQPLQRA